MAPPLVLVVDDEPDLVELVTLTLSRMNVAAQSAGDVASAKKLLKATRFDLCLTDMRLPDGDGLDLVEWMNTHTPGVPCAVITAHGNVESAVRALELPSRRLHACLALAKRHRARLALPAWHRKRKVDRRLAGGR